MTRRDYILIAAALKRALTVSTIEDRRYGVERAALILSDALAQDNPKFDRQRFLAEIGVRGIEVPKQIAPVVYILCRTGSNTQWGQASYTSRAHAQEVAEYHFNNEEELLYVKEKVL